MEAILIQKKCSNTENINFVSSIFQRFAYLAFSFSFYVYLHVRRLYSFSGAELETGRVDPPNRTDVYAIFGQRPVNVTLPVIGPKCGQIYRGKFKM